MDSQMRDPPLRSPGPLSLHHSGWTKRKEGGFREGRVVGSRIPASHTGHRGLSDAVWVGSEFLPGLPMGLFRGAWKPGFEGWGREELSGPRWC